MASKLNLSTVGMCIGDLKRALAKCSDDMKFDLVLNVHGRKKQDSQCTKLSKLCYKLANALHETMRCVSVCAEKEKKTGEKTVYYEGKKGFNCGAVQLEKDTQGILDSFYEELVQIDMLA